MSKIKSLIDYDVKENIDYSAICVKFAMMSKQIEEYQKALDETTSKKIDLENIIKEVREYIVTHKLYKFKYDNEELFEIVTDKKAKDELLEILDKENK